MSIPFNPQTGFYECSECPEKFILRVNADRHYYLDHIPQEYYRNCGVCGRPIGNSVAKMINNKLHCDVCFTSY